MREHDDRDLRALLREEAERHHPDRDAMLSRIVTTRTGSVRPSALFRLRPLAAAGGVAVVLVASIAGARLIGSGSPDDQVAAPSTAVPTSAPASAAPGSSAPGSSAPGSSAPGSRPPASAPSSSATDGGQTTGGPQVSTSSGSADRPRAKSGFLSSATKLDPNSNVGWSQSDLLLTTTKVITELEVTITVVKTAGVAQPDKWSSIPPEMMTNTVTEKSDKIIYRYVLKAGNSLSPREYIFAAQYHHATEGHPLAGDTYTAKSGDVEVAGTF